MKNLKNEKRKFLTFFVLFFVIGFGQTPSFAEESLSRNLSICPSKILAIYDTSGIKKYNCQQSASITWKELVSLNSEIRNAKLSSLKSSSLNVTPVASVLGTFGVEISAEVRIGGNECDAKGMNARLFKAQKGDVIFVMPAIIRDAVVPKMCDKNFNPVFKKVSITLYGSEKINGVIIQNLTVDQHRS